MSKKSKERKITIDAMYPIPLDELLMQMFTEEEDHSLLIDYIYHRTSFVEFRIKKVIKRIFRFQKSSVRLRTLKFAYNDSDNISHGIAYFKVTLRGTGRELRKVAGENKIFMFDWEEVK
jgi:hypothetical protein